MELQQDIGLSYLLIAHDLAVVRHVSDIIAVMYLGKIVEIGPAQAIFGTPFHAYTKALISAIPVPDPTVQKRKNYNSWRSTFPYKSTSRLRFWTSDGFSLLQF